MLSIVVINTCVHIEFWNYLSGGDVLPNREGGKLRYMIGETEGGWRRYHSIQTQDQSLLSGRQLTVEEKELFDEHSQIARNRNKVVSWSRGMGTLQYILAPIAFIWSVFLSFRAKKRRARLIAGMLTLTNALSVFFMLFRGYFND